jgi:electron transfer flavoprotein alpha/beta subunit
MPNAILHTATRVLRRITVIEPPPLGADEMAQVVSDGFTPQHRFTVLLANGTQRAATAQEALGSGVDEDAVLADRRQKLLDLRNRAIAMRDDATVATSVKQFAAALLAYLRP